MCEQEGPSHATKMERHYFPERFGFDLFGDPFEHKREWVVLPTTLRKQETAHRCFGWSLTICVLRVVL